MMAERLRVWGLRIQGFKGLGGLVVLGNLGGLGLKGFRV